jgi:integrase
MTLGTQKRRRRQEGWVELDRQTSPHSWKARWMDWTETHTDKNGRVRPAQRSLVLGYKIAGDLLTKSLAQARWEKMRPLVTARNGSGDNPAPTFSQYVNGRFVPEKNALRPWRARSRDKFDYLMSKIMPVFGAKELAAITTADLQRFLVELARKHCHDTVVGMMMYVRAIFDHAIDNDLLARNPGRKLLLPATREPNRPYLTGEQLGQLEARLAGQDRTIFRLLSRTGLRAGELFGLQWQDVNPNQTVSIQRTFSKGEIGPPKTKASAKPVALPKTLYAELIAIQKAAVDPSPTGWVFPSSKKRGEDVMPIASENWLKRVLKPVAALLGFAVTLHMFRRGFATLAHASGGTLRDIQEQLRHASAATTANVYVQSVPESVRETVEKMDRALRKKAKAAKEKV